MALIRCRECGKEISDQSMACVQCGCPVNPRVPARHPNVFPTPPPVVIRERRGSGCIGGALKAIGILVVFAVVISIANTNNTRKNTATFSSSTITRTTTPRPTQTPAPEIMNVDYKKLHKAFMDNPIAADKEYKGKLLRLTGPVDNIDREIMGNTYITFKMGYFDDVRMTFQRAEEENVANLKKGQKVTVVGECTGTLLSSSVTLKDCYLEK